MKQKKLENYKHSISELCDVLRIQNLFKKLNAFH